MAFGSSPRPTDYDPTRSERVSADVAKQQADFFKRQYTPAMRAQLADAEMDMTKTIEGRANADIAQAVDAQGTSYDDAITGASGKELMQAKIGAGGEASRRSLEGRNLAGTNIVGAAQGQQDVIAKSRMEQATMDTDTLLTDLQNKKDTRAAKIAAGASIATSAILGAKEFKDRRNQNIALSSPGEQSAYLSYSPVPTRQPAHMPASNSFRRTTQSFLGTPTGNYVDPFKRGG